MSNRGRPKHLTTLLKEAALNPDLRDNDQEALMAAADALQAVGVRTAQELEFRLGLRTE